MMMARLIEPDKGEIFLNHQNIADIKTAVYAKHVATLYVKHPALICA